MVDYIFDVDGTIADVEHRRHYVATKPKNWKAFNAAMSLDQPIEPVVLVLRSLASLPMNRVVLCSGRGEENRHVTEWWLDMHAIPYHALYMRAEKDNRADYIVKEELLHRLRVDGYDPEMVFDDRNSVVAMWRRNGLICAQVAEGDF